MADEDAPGGDRSPSVVAAIAVHIKLPPFCPTDPVIWFGQVEAMFTTGRITGSEDEI